MAIGIQQNDVWAAADALLRGGEQPTIERVRLHLGRGSPNTVGPHLKAWFKELGGRIEGRQSLREAPDAVTAAAQQLWGLALDQARQQATAEIEADRAALELERMTLAHERQLAVDTQTRLRQRESDLQLALAMARAQAEEAQSRATDLQGQVGQMQAQLERLQKERDQALGVAQTAQLQGQQALVAAEAAHRAALAQAEQRHASHEKRWLLDLDAQRQAAKKALDEVELLRRTGAQREKTHQETLDELRDSAGKREKDLNDSLRAVERDLNESRAALAGEKAQTELTMRAAQEARERLIEHQRDSEALARGLREQLAVKDAQIASLLAARPTGSETKEE